MIVMVNLAMVNLVMATIAMVTKAIVTIVMVTKAIATIVMVTIAMVTLEQHSVGSYITLCIENTEVSTEKHFRLHLKSSCGIIKYACVCTTSPFLVLKPLVTDTLQWVTLLCMIVLDLGKTDVSHPLFVPD